jgi:uncharacterized protein (DUF305 family)
MRRIVLAVVAAALLTACNQGDQRQGTPATAAPNDADVTFTQNMIPHHRQAIEMAKLIGARTTRPELRQLADSVTASQGHEITQMEDWLQGWGKAAPAGTDHDAMQMPGMMRQAEMQRLMDLQDVRFDLAFIDMMTAHHRGAIQMANTELRDGSLPQVKDLAQQIIDAQQTEIHQLQRWKQDWSVPPIR